MLFLLAGLISGFFAKADRLCPGGAQSIEMLGQLRSSRMSRT